MEPRAAPRSPLFPRLQLLLTVRYLQSRLSSYAALLSVTFGVAVILIVLSIMGGYMEALRESIRGQDSHLTVYGGRPFSVDHIDDLAEAVGAVPGVAATAPYVETLAMYKSGQFNPCRLRGIDPRKQVAVSGLGSYVLRPAELDQVLANLGMDAPPADGAGTDGRKDRSLPIRLVDEALHLPGRPALSPEEMEGLFGPEHGARLLAKRNPATLEAFGGTPPPAALVGIHLLLDRQMVLGQAVPIITIDPSTHEAKHEWFLVAGAFKTGDYDSDSQAIYVHVDALKNVLDLFDSKEETFRYEGLRIAVTDLARINDTRERIHAALRKARPDRPDLQVVSWEELRKTLLRAVAIEKNLIYVLLVVLLSFAGCMVLLMLLLTVIEKTRDMGILLALGAPPGSIVRIFLGNGLIISAAGTALGLALGYVFCLYINPIHDWIYRATGRKLFDAKIYHMDRIPITFEVSDTLLSIAPPIVLGFLASLLPAIWASRRDPIKAIHYE